MTRICCVCKRPLEQRPVERDHHFLNRKTCGKDSGCYKLAYKKNAVLYADTSNTELAYTNPLDAEQREIDRAAHLSDLAKMGLVKDHGRTLSRDEIDGLIAAGKITPLEEIRHCVAENIFI